MNISKLFTVICAFVLIVCLVLSITTLIVLRNAIAENQALQRRAEGLIGELDRSVSELAVYEKNEENTDLPTSASPNEHYVVSLWQDHVAVFSSAGELLYCSSLSALLLPPSERRLLEKGIQVETLSELIKLFTDYAT